jgi:hypothetical protein
LAALPGSTRSYTGPWPVGPARGRGSWLRSEGGVEVFEGLGYLAGVLWDGRGGGKDLAGAVLHLEEALAAAAFAALGAVSPFTSTMSRE